MNVTVPAVHVPDEASLFHVGPEHCMSARSMNVSPSLSLPSSHCGHDMPTGHFSLVSVGSEQPGSETAELRLKSVRASPSLSALSSHAGHVPPLHFSDESAGPEHPGSDAAVLTL